jgi:hypothetical protein
MSVVWSLLLRLLQIGRVKFAFSISVEVEVQL